eukprot:scaffold99162_cov63-Phaeocystis_antarctica.AAC.1
MWGKRGAAARPSSRTACSCLLGLLVLAISDTPTRTSSSRTATVVSRTATASKKVCIRARLAGLALRTNRRMAYIGSILRGVQITQ